MQIEEAIHTALSAPLLSDFDSSRLWINRVPQGVGFSSTYAVLTRVSTTTVHAKGTATLSKSARVQLTIVSPEVGEASLSGRERGKNWLNDAIGVLDNYSGGIIKRMTLEGEGMLFDDEIDCHILFADFLVSTNE